MHGVKRRVKTSEEVERERKREELQRVEKFKSLCQQFAERQNANALDEDTFSLTTKLLDLNTEFYTLWNYRRLIFIEWFKHKTSEEMNPILDKELKYLEQAIAMNPKSYWIWLHRVWVTSKSTTVDWQRELKLCGKLLALDSRNFHCWNYRRYVAQQLNATLQDEFAFTTTKIEENFSNYSAWHQRSSLLPQMFADDKEGLKNALNEEFELVKNAFYTEPKDQSAWFYHRWLVDTICGLFTGPDAEKEKEQIIQRELKMCEELEEIEPNCKWSILTRTFLMMKIKGYETQILENFTQLAKLDPPRTRYYEDMKAKINQKMQEKASS